MRIAINTRFLIKDRLEGFGHYTHELLSRLTRNHPADTFDFYFDSDFSQEFVYAENVNARSVFPPARHPLLFYLWYQYALRNVLRSTTPDIFFSPDSFMPLGLGCPSVITVHDVAHKRYPAGIPFEHRKYYQYFMPKFLKEAAHIITVSEFSKHEILKYYPIREDKISVIYNGIGEGYTPVSADEQLVIRKQYTQGYPYFLFVGAIHPRKNVARLIEAYSLFRKTYDGLIKLLIVGRKSWKYRDVERAIVASAYRDDILFTGYAPVRTLGKITASAHALSYVSLYEGFGLPVAEAMACGVPVIVSQNSAHAEIAGEAGIQVDPESIENIARAMRQISDDNTLRDTCINAGLKRSGIFSWDRAAEATYSALSSQFLDHH